MGSAPEGLRKGSDLHFQGGEMGRASRSRIRALNRAEMDGAHSGGEFPNRAAMVLGRTGDMTSSRGSAATIQGRMGGRITWMRYSNGRAPG